MLRVLLLLLALSGSATAACVLDAVTVPDTLLTYAALKPGGEQREVTVQVSCERAQDRYRLQLAGSVQVGPGGWSAELWPRRGGGERLRVTFVGAAEVFGPGVSFGGTGPDLQATGPEGPRRYTHTLILRALPGQWVTGGDYVSDMRVAIHDL